MSPYRQLPACDPSFAEDRHFSAVFMPLHNCHQLYIYFSFYKKERHCVTSFGHSTCASNFNCRLCHLLLHYWAGTHYENTHGISTIPCCITGIKLWMASCMYYWNKPMVMLKTSGISCVTACSPLNVPESRHVYCMKDSV